MQLVVHDITRQRLAHIRQQPPHALIVAAPSGSGKDTLVRHLVADLLQTPVERLSSSARLMIVAPADGEAFGIDQARQVQHFMTRKSQVTTASVGRIAYLPEAHTMTREAQNALLKLLEEPPTGSMLILTATSERALLPTIVSRSQVLQVQTPELAALQTALQQAGHDDAAIALALRISDGLPGLTVALLEDKDHALAIATEEARSLLRQSAFERVARVDGLSKQRGLSLDICYILQQMAHIALQTSQGAAAVRWQRVLQAAYETRGALERRANAKLALTQLMLSL